MSLLSPPHLVPLTDPFILAVDDTRKPSNDKTVVLTRETTFAIDTNKPYKLNAGTYVLDAFPLSYVFSG